MLTLQLKYACESLKNVNYTDLGQKIFNYYQDRINNVFLKKAVDEKLFELEPFFMEYHDEILDNSKVTIRDIVESHHSIWSKINK
jgi:hypothetical protein